VRLFQELTTRAEDAEGEQVGGGRDLVTICWKCCSGLQASVRGKSFRSKTCRYRSKPFQNLLYFRLFVICSTVLNVFALLQVTKEEATEGCTKYAQGGVSAVLAELDSVEDHVQDTMVAGDFLNVRE